MRRDEEENRMVWKTIYSKRRSIGLEIERDGNLVVRAPEYATDREIENAVQNHRGWIEKKKTEMIREEQRRKKYARIYEDGSFMPLLGKEYPLRIVEVPGFGKTRITFQKEKFYVCCEKKDKKELQAAFVEWYYHKAVEIYRERISYYRKIIREPFYKVTIRDQKTRYGSCSSRRNLNFNWRCILAPVECVDYVIIHEMCHLKEMNHSSRFWAYVEQYQKDYRVWKQWLKEHQPELEAI